MNGNNILTDPYFDNNDKCSDKRGIDCEMPISNIPKIDNILISHEHFDAFDIINTNLIVKKCKPKVIAHRSVLNKIDCNENYKVSMDEYKTKTIKDISYTAYPAHHPTSFYPLSYLIADKKNSIYFSGDTFMTKEHDKIKADVAILPIGKDYT